MNKRVRDKERVHVKENKRKKDAKGKEGIKESWNFLGEGEK